MRTLNRRLSALEGRKGEVQPIVIRRTLYLDKAGDVSDGRVSVGIPGARSWSPLRSSEFVGGGAFAEAVQLELRRAQGRDLDPGERAALFVKSVQEE